MWGRYLKLSDLEKILKTQRGNKEVNELEKVDLNLILTKAKEFSKTKEEIKKEQYERVSLNF